MVGSPTSPVFPQSTRPMSAVIRPSRSSSRMSVSSRTGGGSRASDEDGRTSVKVAVRVRPPLRATDPGFDLIPQRFQKGMVHVTSPTSLAVDSPQGRKIFVFDRVFGEEIDQDGIWQYLEESVNAFVQGYNVSLLAYGQSGAGKSYTMGTSSPDAQSDHRIMGVIPRAATALFEKLSSGAPNNHSRNSSTGLRAPSRYSTPVSILQNRSSENKNWTMKASYVEIYNEQLRDLLLPDGTRSEDRTPINIREDTKGRIILTGLHQVTINSVEDLLEALNFGSSIRQTDATAINAKSSRSHAVFSLNLIQRKPKVPNTNVQKEERRFSVPTEMMGQDSYVTVDSKMHFVDLAGSERLKNTHAQGERAREGISINAGLASLGKVISQLSSRQAGSHVSYRDSKLTRLLQDSLGGNAITYMIACVTPAEFHLSETLNTIQYAQRARAIQSKPKIQQVSDDSDMRALVERLRAEVAFLREQIKNNSESSERPIKGDKTRPERSNEKERELQNQLLDLQENYGALSQRHAKLISEIARARENESATAPATDYNTNSAVERLKRSNSFAEAVEQVVLEYEKTIESLESSLSSTRSSLSVTESSLLEKETKLAYIETVNQQLQTRIQKLMDRESSTESYLHDLEAKLDSHTSGEEKNAAIIAELRKEIARVRENEASCEDYISTLEERLAEADQDLELMTREIARLEHVVERQRSLGKLDNLLYELDSLKEQDSNKAKGGKMPKDETLNEEANGNVSDEDVNSRRESKKSEKMEFSAETIKEEEEEAFVDAQEKTENRGLDPSMNRNYLPPQITLGDPSEQQSIEYPPQSPAQSQFVADKLESVQQELFDLKVEHEATLNEYDQMSANYEAALRDLASLQDQLDELRHSKGSSTQSASPPPSPSPRPTSFLVDARVSGLKDMEGQDSSSRSLSSELSLVGDSPISSVITDGEATAHLKEALEAQRIASKEKEEALSRELERLKKEKEEEHDRLHLQLRHSLDQLADLKTSHRTSGVMSSSNSQVLRRKSSQSLAMLDRAQRTFANLRRIAMEHLESQPEVLENFELNIDGALRELVTRSDRIMELESDVLGLRKDMESKQAIITGLTRERSSISTTPIDISVVAVMERRIEESEAELVNTKELLAEREAELDIARRAMEERSGESQSDAASLLVELTKERSLNAKQSKKIAELQGELQQAKTSHDVALDSLKQSKDALSKTLVELEAEFSKSMSDAADERALKEAAEEEKAKHQERVDALQKIISDNRATIDIQLSRVAELERTHAAAQRQIDLKLTSADSSEAAIKKHQAIALELEQTIAQNRQTIESQQARLSILEESYKDALGQLAELRDKEAAAIDALKKAEDRASVAGANDVQSKPEGSEAIEAAATSLSKLQASYAEATALIEKLEKDKSAAVSESEERTAALRKEITENKEAIEKHLETVKQLQELYAQSQQEIEKLTKKEAKHAKMLEDLEEQLTFNFDQNQETKNQLKKVTEDYERLQQERETLIAESTAKNTKAQELIDSLNDEITNLKTKLAEKEMELQGLDNGRTQRSNSTSSANLRKSASSASLPSPPPAIPLPPLPSAGAATAQTPASPNMSRRPSKDYAHAQAHIEDQEARIKTLEKQLQAEKALTATLEEALTDCEKTMKRLTTDRDSFQAKASQVQQELDRAKSESQSSRYSMQAVEEERLGRLKAEQAREQLEQRMQALAKKKRSFACF